MKIEVRQTKNLDINDVICRSPVATNPHAVEVMKRYLLVSIVSWTGFVDDRAACVWGLVAPSLLSSSAYLWLLTTDLAHQHPLVFIRHSQIMVKEMLKIYPVIEGHVIADQEKSIRWLKWLGVTFLARDKGVIGFEMRANNG